MISTVPAFLIALLSLSVQAQQQVPCPRPQDCLNSATCVAYQQASTSNVAQLCLCTPQWTGMTCAIPITSGTTTPMPTVTTQPLNCATANCQNGGVCGADSSGRAACYCRTPSYYGPSCQYPNPCKADYCKNGGICYISAANQALCSCPPNCLLKDSATCEKCTDACFAENASVTLESGRNIPIQDISLGDRVLSFDSEGKLSYSPVLMWIDRVPNIKISLVRLTTESGSVFKATSFHVVAVGDAFIQMKDVKVGDMIHLVDQRNQQMRDEKVVLVDEVAEADGAYAPLTEQGTIVVDGVGASCYAYSHRLGQIVYAPMKLMTKLGLVSGKADRGLHWYSNMWVDMMHTFNMKPWLTS